MMNVWGKKLYLFQALLQRFQKSDKRKCCQFCTINTHKSTLVAGFNVIVIVSQNYIALNWVKCWSNFYMFFIQVWEISKLFNQSLLITNQYAQQRWRRTPCVEIGHFKDFYWSKKMCQHPLFPSFRYFKKFYSFVVKWPYCWLRGVSPLHLSLHLLFSVNCFGIVHNPQYVCVDIIKV